MSHAFIRIGDKRVKLNLEPKAKYIVLKLDDTRVEILYVDTRHGTYMMTSIEKDVTEPLVPDRTNEWWKMEFYGSFSCSNLGARIVLMSPRGKKFPKDYKLIFETINNTKGIWISYTQPWVCKRKGDQITQGIGRDKTSCQLGLKAIPNKEYKTKGI